MGFTKNVTNPVSGETGDNREHGDKVRPTDDWGPVVSGVDQVLLWNYPYEMSLQTGGRAFRVDPQSRAIKYGFQRGVLKRKRGRGGRKEGVTLSFSSIRISF